MVKKKKICLQCRRPWVSSWMGKICWRRDRLPPPVFLGFSCGSASKESTCSTGDLDLIPRLGRSPGEGKDNPLQYSGLENSVDCIVHGVAKSRTRLSDFHFHFLSPVLKGYWKWRFPSAYQLLTVKSLSSVVIESLGLLWSSSPRV